MIDFGLSGLTSGAMGLLQAKQNFEYSKQLNEQQFQIQQKLASQQNQFNIDMWNRENEYNSAESQVQRLRDAGLNVGMMMGGQSAGVATGLESANPAVPQSAMANFADYSGVGSAIGLALNREIEKKKLQLQDKLTSRQLDQVDEKIDYERKKALSEVGLNEIIGKEKEQNIELSKDQQEVLRSSVVKMNKEVDSLDKQMALYDAQTEETKALAEKARQEGNYVKYNAITQRMNAISQRMQAQASSRLANSQIKVNDTVVSLNKQQAKHLVQQIENLRTTNRLNNVELEWKGKTYKADFEMKQGQLRILQIQGDIANATQYAEMANAYIGVIDNAANTVSDCATSF